ncbi:MAG: D-2-hydroxyacid dehydrogenase [Bacteroidetes bacterium]|jgi:D-3-phosphoglycerate dehydrogenase|nr:D-2-hydroxyacid dehydrogenase [Bacteroidota bacterium]
MKILITDGISPEGAKILTDAGHQVDQVKLTPDELLKRIGGYDGIVVRSATKVTKEVIDAGKNLKLIARGGVGLDNIDVPAAEARSIKVMNTPGASAISVAELAIGHMLAVSRFLNVSTTEMRQGNWPKKEYSQGFELYKKSLGIIGLGNIGKEVARRALAFGMHVLAYDPPFTPMDFFVEITTKERVLANADFLTLHIPFDKKTGPAIGKKEFDMMKKGVVVINCSRGGVVDEAALLDALNSGKVAGAGLDVFAQEPPTEAIKALLAHPRVSVSPHIGGSTIEAQDRVGVEIALKVVKTFESEGHA